MRNYAIQIENYTIKMKIYTIQRERIKYYNVWHATLNTYTVKHGYMEQAYEELTLRAKRFLFAVLNYMLLT